jgi:hypothetical protein
MSAESHLPFLYDYEMRHQSRALVKDQIVSDAENVQPHVCQAKRLQAKCLATFLCGRQGFGDISAHKQCYKAYSRPLNCTTISAIPHPEVSIIDERLDDSRS